MRTLQNSGTVLISPFANERLREWPMPHFRRLIELVLGRHFHRVLIVGTRAQRVRANDLVRGFSSADAVNACGTLSWGGLNAAVDSSRYVVSNNSGVAHLAASRSCWTLCLFAASHSWQEWMPRGPRVVVMSRSTLCAPCEVGSGRCPNGIACMTTLDPEFVFEHFSEILRRGAR